MLFHDKPVDVSSVVSICEGEQFDINTMAPFATCKKIQKFNKKLYESDICYFGDLDSLDDSIHYFLNLDYNVKIFSPKPTMLYGNSGVLRQDKVPYIYSQSKCSIVPSGDIGYREIDIIYAGGNPVRFKDRDSFISSVKDAVAGKREGGIMSVEDVHQSHTQYDRMASIFKSVGLEKISKLLINNKPKLEEVSV